MFFLTKSILNLIKRHFVDFLHTFVEEIYDYIKLVRSFLSALFVPSQKQFMVHNAPNTRFF